MRCPKCHYISYDSSDRCRNCGYEFALAIEAIEAREAREVELPIQTGEEALGPLSDFPLADPRQAGLVAHAASRPSPPPSPTPRSTRTVTAHRRAGTDLPLFNDRRPEGGAPPVSATALPRAPLSVRRANPVVARTMVRTPASEPILDLETADGAHTPRAAAGSDMDAPTVPEQAGAGRRLGAAIVDAVVLGSINAGVVYLTLQICGFSVVEIVLLPPVPLITFLLLLDGGYLAAFTAAGGQTLGKMAAGIKVVSESGADRVKPRSAVLRSAGYLVSALPAGLGFLPALFASDGRAVHDRLAHTRVIKA